MVFNALLILHTISINPQNVISWNLEFITNLMLWPNRRKNIANTSEIANHRAKGSKIGTPDD